jgi:hypothetical protein
LVVETASSGTLSTNALATALWYYSNNVKQISNNNINIGLRVTSKQSIRVTIRAKIEEMSEKKGQHVYVCYHMPNQTTFSWWAGAAVRKINHCADYSLVTSLGS